MIVEHAILNVKSGQQVEFESSFAKAKQIISRMKGFNWLKLYRYHDESDQYLLLVEWQSVEDHTEGFRKSPQYQQWSSLLHSYYEPFPEVKYYDLIQSC